MIAGILGDIIGSVYEGYQWKEKGLDLISKVPVKENKDITCLVKDISFVREKPFWTDDTLTSLALYFAYEKKLNYSEALRDFCNHYSELEEGLGFGSSFIRWLKAPVPYNSYGNGCLMRIGFIPYLKEGFKQKLNIALNTCVITHNHQDSIEAVANYIWIAERFKDNPDYFKVTIGNYLKNINEKRNLEDLHKEKKFVLNAFETFKQSLIILYYSNNMKEVLENCFYVGGDSDTLACITSNLAELVFPIYFPKEIQQIFYDSFRKYPELLNIIQNFNNKYHHFELN